MGEKELPLDGVIGEGFGENLSRPVARHANARLNGNGQNTYIDLGEHGQHSTRDVRFRDSAKEGFLSVYTRSRVYSSEHKAATTIAVSTIAIGAVLTGIAALKHRK